MLYVTTRFNTIVELNEEGKEGSPLPPTTLIQTHNRSDQTPSGGQLDMED